MFLGSEHRGERGPCGKGGRRGGGSPGLAGREAPEGWGYPGGRERSDAPLRHGMGQRPTKRPPRRGGLALFVREGMTSRTF